MMVDLQVGNDGGVGVSVSQQLKLTRAVERMCVGTERRIFTWVN